MKLFGKSSSLKTWKKEKGTSFVDIETIRQRVKNGDYLIKSHAVTYALKEGFDRQQMTEATSNGKIIEEYPDDERV